MVKKILSIILWTITGAALIVLFVFGRNWYLESPLKGINLSLERNHMNGFVERDSLLAQAESICDLAHQNNISNVDLQRINKLLTDNPWIVSKGVFRRVSCTLCVQA